MKDLLYCVQQSKELEEKINLIKKELNYYENASPEDIAIENIEAVKNEISSFLQKSSNILMKVVKLSNGQLVIKNNNVVYNGHLNLPKIDMSNPKAEILRFQNEINNALKKMSVSGVRGEPVVSLGRGLQSLYEIYLNIDETFEIIAIKYQKEIKEKYKQLVVSKKALEKEKKELETTIKELKSLNKKTFDLFGFEKITLQDKYLDEIKMSYALNDLDVKTWDLVNDGILSIICNEDNCDTLINFIKALMMKFLYSYPNLDKQVLYLSKKSNDDMNNFLNRLNVSLGKEIFFYGMQKLDSYEFERDLISVFSNLKQTLEERSSLLDKEGLDNILEYNLNNPNDLKNPIFVVLNNYPFGFEHTIDLDYFFENGKKAGIYFLVLQTKEDLKLNSLHLKESILLQEF